MKSLLIAMVILASLAPARAEEPAAKDRAESRLYFRLRVGVSAGIEITGYLTESAGRGTGFDTALLDFDGDGEFEKKLRFGQTVHPRSGRRRRDARIPVRHEGAIWTLEIDALNSSDANPKLAAGTTLVHWSVRRGGLFVRFLGAPLALFRSAGEAEKNGPFRMGPPLSLEVGASTRGSSPTVTLDLKGPNGGSLAAVIRDRKQVKPEVRVSADGRVQVTAHPGYS